jgi:hypothetical protein
MAVLAEHCRHGLVKEGKIKLSDVYQFKFGILAFSRNVESPSGHYLGLPAWPRTPDDDTDFNHDSPLLKKPIRATLRLRDLCEGRKLLITIVGS